MKQYHQREWKLIKPTALKSSLSEIFQEQTVWLRKLFYQINTKGEFNVLSFAKRKLRFNNTCSVLIRVLIEKKKLIGLVKRGR